MEKASKLPCDSRLEEGRGLKPDKELGAVRIVLCLLSVCSLEAMYKKEKGILPQLSEQQIVDCSGSLGKSGCKGGNPQFAFNYFKLAKAMTRSSYVYTAVKGSCKYNAATGVINTSGYKTIANGDPNAHIAAL